MWIRCSLAGILSIMHILFAKYSPQPPSAPQPIRMGEPISRRISFPKSDDTPTKSPQSSKPSKVCSKMIDFDKLFSEFFLKNKSARPLAVAVVRKRDSAPLPQGVSRHNNGAECSNIGSSDKGEEPGRNPEITNCDEIMSWDPLYMKSTLTIAQDEPSSDSMFQRRNKEPNLLQKMRDNFSNDRESDLKPNRVINKNIKNDWPMTEWNEIQNCLDEQSDTDHEAFIASPVSAKHCVYDINRNDRRSNLDPTGSIMTQVLSNSSPSSVGLNSSNTTSLAGTAIVGNSSNQISTSSHTKSKVKSHVHISPITGTLFFIVIQSIGDPKHVKKRTVSDEDISLFMSSMVSKICPDNLFTTNSILDAKFEMATMHTKSTTAAGGGERAPSQSRAKLDNQLPESLWSDTGWESQRKKILNTLGIRHNNSPITAPLKSPYIKRQIGRSGGRQRKKKVKSSFNDGHLDFFLGPELSQALQY